MRLRHLSTGMLLLALLVSAWSSVLAAIMCPHMALSHACCHAKVQGQGHASHEGMEGMQMGDSAAGPAESEATELNAPAEPLGTCQHCMGQSQPLVPASVAREGDRPKHGDELTARPAIKESVSTVSSFIPKVLAREHAPPGASPSQRHVFLNVFRI